MARLNKFFNSHIIIVSTVIIVTSFVALLFVNTERFFSTASSSILAPEFDFNAKLKVLTDSQKNKHPSTVREELLVKLANEHVPIIMCGFYDLITGPKRLQKPDNIDEGQWLQQVWTELMEGMGIPSGVYMSIMQLRYSWFSETRDTFETFQAKLEPSFVKATLERYVNSNGNFVPTSVDKYNQALQCKLYRAFSKSASLLNYMGGSTQAKISTTTSNSVSPSASYTASTSAQPSSASTQPSTTSTISTSTQHSTALTSTSTSAQPSTASSNPSTSASTQPSTASTNPSTPTQAPVTTNTSPKPLFDTPVFKWAVPSNFTAMCLDNGNRFQCFLMSVLFVISIVCVIAVITSLVAPFFSQQNQNQSQF
jgi:hypothetical protein